MSAPDWFDGKLSLGNIITILTVMIGLAAGWFEFDNRLSLAEAMAARQVQQDKDALADLKNRVDRNERSREDLRERVIRIETQLTAQDTKLDAILRNTARPAQQ